MNNQMPAVTLATMEGNRRWRTDRRFFMGMAIATAIVAFIGFAPTYYLKPLYSAPALSPLVHLHGFLMTAWIVLLGAQTYLVRVRRTDLHRRLGVGGAILAALIATVTVLTAIAAVRAGRISPGRLAIPFGTVVQFLAFVGAAVALRRTPEAHKRLMLIATTVFLTASVGRWKFVYPVAGAFGVYAVTDLLVVAMVIYDLVTRRRVHPALVWGGLGLVAAQFLQERLGHTDTWLAVATWLTR
jgi:hypothetical protein